MIIVVPLNIHHEYAKLSSQSCVPSPTDHGSPVSVDDTSGVPVSLSIFSNDSVCNSQKVNTEESDAGFVVADDSDITDDYSSDSALMGIRKSVLLPRKKTFPFFCTCKTARLA